MAFDDPPYVIDGTTVDGEVIRRAISTLLDSAGGIVTSGDLEITQNGTPDMSVNMAAGEIWVPGSSSTSQGLYYGRNGAVENLPIDAADGTNPRIDTVIVQVQDAFYAGSGKSMGAVVLAGTPTAGASYPANTDGVAVVPASSYVVGYLNVGAGVSSIVTADIYNVAKVTTTRFAPSIITASGAVTAPTGARYAKVMMQGGGGGGGGGDFSTGTGGGGGGGGQYVCELVSLSGVSGLTATIGGGGTGGALSARGTDGGSTSLSGSGLSTITAKGGHGGSWGTLGYGGSYGGTGKIQPVLATQTSGAYGPTIAGGGVPGCGGGGGLGQSGSSQPPANGGDGGAGIGFGGAGGGGGGAFYNGGSGIASAGAGGAPGGGAGGVYGPAAGANATGYGNGGGGCAPATGSQVGGNGSAGIIIIEWL